MKRLNTLASSLVALAFVATNTFAQQIVIGEPGHPLSNTADCATFGTAGLNFIDNGLTGNYPPNTDVSTTFCPTLTSGTKMTVMFGTDQGAQFNVHASDTVYIYDGPDINSPLLGAINSSTNPTGGPFQASWNNPSGCLTVRFKSDGANEGSGWIGSAQCGNPVQPFEMHLEAFVNGQGPNALNPIDTGYVDVCFGDSILFVAKPLFPHSSENNAGAGYSQNVNNVNYTWNISDGNTYPNNDSVWFKPPTRNGFLVELAVRDGYPQTKWINSKVRVSQIPNFSTTGPLSSTICLGETTNLLGGVTASDTVGVSVPAGSFQLGGNHAGTTYLPDGNGHTYTTAIPITGFPSGSTIQNASDLNEVCLTIEHSFLGDLEIWLECPPVAPATTGLYVGLIDGYNGGFLPGGGGGGGKFLGHPYDDWGGGNAGIGWEYCFSSAFNTYGPMSTGGYGNTVPVTAQAGPPQLSSGTSMNPNVVYEPVTNFTALQGCPINGNWKIHVRDNQSIDDGTIFEWSLYFDAAFLPGAGNYQNTIESSWWNNDPSIISGQNDTSIVVLPPTIGDHSYTFNVIDDYGCAYDTTVTITVRPLPVIFGDTVACNNQFQVSGTQTFNGGVWSSTSPNISFSNANNANPLITATAPGTYSVGFLDNTCQYPQMAEILFPIRPSVFADTTVCNLTFNVDTSKVHIHGGGTWSSFAGGPVVTFGPNASQNATTFTFPESGNYMLTLTDSICGNSDAVTITVYEQPRVFAPDYACYMNSDQVYATSFAGGSWTLQHPNGTILDDTVFANGPTNSYPHPVVQDPGDYIISFTDTQCNITVSDTINFPPYLFTEINDTLICSGMEYALHAYIPNSPVSFAWNTGATGNAINITEPGQYIVTVSNQCHHYTDTAIVTYQLCDIEAPNVISLSSKDGNNLWFVKNQGIADFECVIVNRWGNIIHEFNDVNGKWDGRDKGGNVVSEGVYFYTIKAKIFGGDELVKQGFIQVVK